MKHMHEMSLEQGCIMRGNKIIIPGKLQERVLNEIHEGHSGIVVMKSLARSYVWWPNMDLEIEYLVKDCSTCQQNQRSPSKSPVHHWEYPSNAWKRIHVDHAGPA